MLSRFRIFSRRGSVELAPSNYPPETWTASRAPIRRAGIAQRGTYSILGPMSSCYRQSATKNLNQTAIMAADAPVVASCNSGAVADSLTRRFRSPKQRDFMRLSRYFLPILRETPKEAEIVSHRLMLRAGMIRQEAAGIYAFLPLGLRVLR